MPNQGIIYDVIIHYIRNTTFGAENDCATSIEKIVESIETFFYGEPFLTWLYILSETIFKFVWAHVILFIEVGCKFDALIRNPTAAPRFCDLSTIRNTSLFFSNATLPSYIVVCIVILLFTHSFIYSFSFTGRRQPPADINVYIEIAKRKLNSFQKEIHVERAPENTTREQLCSICMENLRNAVFVPCGHSQFCMKCANRVERALFPQCPVCKKNIETSIRLY